VQGTVEQLKSVETQQLASKLDGQVHTWRYYCFSVLSVTVSQAELLRVIAHENKGSREVRALETEPKCCVSANGALCL
jgi:hypothetical protein